MLQYVCKHKKFLCHDENNECHDGDLVIIKECKPYHKTKYFRVVEIIEKAQSYTNPDTGKTVYQGGS